MPDSIFWENHHKMGHRPWELGYVSPPLKAYVDQIKNRNIEVLIPGAGQYYEAEYISDLGFKSVTVCDISESAIENIRKKLGNKPNIVYINDNFFNIKGSFDLILEQTFFCSLDPLFREQYVDKIYELLIENGKLAGLLFASEFPFDGPPFGGDKKLYKKLFSRKLHIKSIDMCYNSVKPRKDNELFIICER